MDKIEEPDIAIILIESEYESPEMIKHIVDQHSDLGERTKISTFNGPAKGVDEGLWMALLVRYGDDRGVDVLSRPYRFFEGKVGSVDYAIAKIY